MHITYSGGRFFYFRMWPVRALAILPNLPEALNGKEVPSQDLQNAVVSSKKTARSRKIKTSTAKNLLLNIQDAHASMGAAGIDRGYTRDLVSKYDLKMIALEVLRATSIRAFLRAFPDENTRREGARFLMKARGI